MCDEWMPNLQLPLSYDDWVRLPRNAAYKYEFLGGRAWLTPRPRFYHALLELPAFAQAPPEQPADEVETRPFAEADWEPLPALFAAAFQRQQPFGGLPDDVRREAARRCLERTRTGGDGPLIPPACFTARDPDTGHTVGAVLVTLLPDGDPTAWDAFHWKDPPPPDCVARRLGRPHLTWIFVGHLHAGRGVGTLLLHAAARALLALGFTRLASTFISGNDSSMLWHWRNGFRLQAYPGSLRKRR